MLLISRLQQKSSRDNYPWHEWNRPLMQAKKLRWSCMTNGCLLCAALLCLVATASAKVVEVRLNNLEIGIDEATGSIVSLASPYMGQLLEANPEAAGLLDVAYPVQPFIAMRLASRFSKATIVRHGPDEVDIEWNQLGASRPNLPIPSGAVKATVTIRAASDGRSVIFACHIDNESDASVRQELFPDLWGLKPIAGVKTTQLRLAREVEYPFDGPITPVDEMPLYATMVGAVPANATSLEGRGWKAYPAGPYYVANSLRWAGLRWLRWRSEHLSEEMGKPRLAEHSHAPHGKRP